MLEIYEEKQKLVSDISKDVYKAHGGNRSAGTRVRTHMQDLKNLCQQMRTSVLLKRSDKDPT